MQYILLILASLLLLGSCSNSKSNSSTSDYCEYELTDGELSPCLEYEYARSVVTPPAANAYNSGEKIVYAISTANNIFKIDLEQCSARFIKKLPDICTDRDARPVVVSKMFMDYKEHDVIVFDADYCQISISPELHRGALFITDNVSSGYGDIVEMAIATGQDMDYGDYNISIEYGMIHIGYCGEDYEIRLLKPSRLTSAIRWNFPFGAILLLISFICILYVIVSIFRSSLHRDGATAGRKTIVTIKELSTMDINNMLQFAEQLEHVSQTTPQQQERSEPEPLLNSEALLQRLPDSLPDSISCMVIEQAKGMGSDPDALEKVVAEIAEGKAIWETLSRIGEITEELSKIDDIIIYRLTEGYEPSAISKSIREKCAQLSERFKEQSRLLYLNLSNADIASLESIGLGARSSFYRDFLLLLVFIDYKSKIGIRKIALLTDSTLATVHARKAELLKNKLGSNIERLAENFNPISLIIKRAYNNLNNI